MNDTARVSHFEGGEHGAHDSFGFRGGQGRGASQTLRESLALQQLHHEVEQPLVLADVVKRDDARVANLTEQPQLTPHPLRARGVRAGVEHLERELGFGDAIPHAVHLAATPAPDEREHFVAPREHVPWAEERQEALGTHGVPKIEGGLVASFDHRFGARSAVFGLLWIGTVILVERATDRKRPRGDAMKGTVNRLARKVIAREIAVDCPRQDALP